MFTKVFESSSHSSHLLFILITAKSVVSPRVPGILRRQDIAVVAVIPNFSQHRSAKILISIRNRSWETGYWIIRTFTYPTMTFKSYLYCWLAMNHCEYSQWSHRIYCISKTRFFYSKYFSKIWSYQIKYVQQKRLVLWQGS